MEKQISFFLPTNLTQYTHVFVCYDAVRALLRPPYDRPFLVIDKTNKYFRIQNDGKDAVVSVDRLKPAFTLVGNIKINKKGLKGLKICHWLVVRVDILYRTCEKINFVIQIMINKSTCLFGALIHLLLFTAFDNQPF